MAANLPQIVKECFGGRQVPTRLDIIYGKEEKLYILPWLPSTSLLPSSAPAQLRRD